MAAAALWVGQKWGGDVLAGTVSLLLPSTFARPSPSQAPATVLLAVGNAAALVVLVLLLLRGGSPDRPSRPANRRERCLPFRLGSGSACSDPGARVASDTRKMRKEWAMRRRLVAILGTLAVAAVVLAVPAAAGGGSSCHLPRFGPGRDYHPDIDPANFSPHVTNRFFPLTPGKTLAYTGTKDGEKALDLFATTRRTKLVDGVRTRVVEDRLYLNNVLAERTSDYYAQDRCGNVWYFGEDTAELDRHGQVISTGGTWHAGVD